MTDLKARSEAFKLWGVHSYISQEWKWSEFDWIKKIGFLSPGCKDEFTVLGSGKETWDAAFEALPVNRGISGPFAIQALLQLYAPQEVESGLITGVQWYADNVAISPLITIDPTQSPWIIHTWDIPTVPDGLHIVCAKMIHADGNYRMSNAILVSIKN